MKPVCVCKICGNSRPGECVQTLFGLNLEKRAEGEILLHGDLRKKEVK